LYEAGLKGLNEYNELKAIEVVTLPSGSSFADIQVEALIPDDDPAVQIRT
jgi:hypothetical protein